ncbi:MAG: SDR family oxidoreductase [Desulfobacteraceae bacterium]|nr:SDR family oxidoreductase [Desulfobacteraceae bacterium]
MRNQNAVAIIGMGCIFPNANGLKQYWRLLLNGEDAITEVPKGSHWSREDYFDKDPSAPDHTYCSRGGFLPAVSFDPARFGLPPNNLDVTDTSQLLGLIVAEMALEDAGYGSKDSFDRYRTNVILGVTGTQELVIPLGARLGHPVWKQALKDSGIPEDKAAEVIRRISGSYSEWQENSFPGLLGNVVAGRIANRLDLGGTNSVVDAACASSLSAVNTAVMELIEGRCDISISGGVDTLNDIFMNMCFAKTGVLSHSGDAKPFSKDADGTVLGEGIGMLVMKRLEDAERDKDRIYAVIKGIGTSSDGKTGGIYAPDAKGQLRALKAAYDLAGVDPASIELIEAHGTGTRVGDKIEFSALKELAKEYSKNTPCAIGSVKSMIGHSKAAAGAAGLIKSVLSLYHKVLPPTLKAEEPDPELDINATSFYLNDRSKPWIPQAETPRRSGISAFGFGGSNFHAVIEEYDRNKPHVSWDGTVQIAAFSAPSKEALTPKLNEFMEALAKAKEWDSRELSQEVGWLTAQTRKSFSSKEEARLLILIKEGDDPAEVVQKAVSLLQSEEESSWSKQNIYLGSGKQKGKLAFLFPGQGSQYTGMGKDLAAIFPEAMDAIVDSGEHFAREWEDKKQPLHHYIFPPPAHRQDKKTSEEMLRSTDVAQPALGSISIAMAAVLKRFNIRPDAACGHSFGELPALWCADRLDREALFSLACARGRYMAESSGASGEKGSMLAVKAPLVDIEAFIKEEKLDLVLANRNSHDQGVLSGKTDQIKKALKLCRKRKMRAVQLPVAAAFHSALVETAAQPFKERLLGFAINAVKVPVYSNTTGAPYPGDENKAKEILGNQLLNSVKFVDNIEAMVESDITTFLEVGPKNVLTGLTRSILKGKDFTAMAVDGSGGRKSGIEDLAKVLCELSAQGFPVDLTQWEEEIEKPKKKMMRIPLTGANIKPKPGCDLPPSKPMDEKPKEEASAPPTQPAPTPQAGSKGAEMTIPESHVQEPVHQVPPRQTEQIPPQATEQMRPPKAQQVQPGAVELIQRGLQSMEALQAQTARTHEKFLETQALASKTLQGMMEQTRIFAQTVVNNNGAPVYNTPVTTSTIPEPAIRPASPRPESLPEAPAPAPEPQAAAPAPRPEPVAPQVVQQTPAVQTEAPAKPLNGTKPKETLTKSLLMDTVSRLTGFPQEMLELDMEIESDLGIDSIKRVEIVSELEKQLPETATLTPENMGSLKTLRDIVEAIDRESGSPAPVTTTATAAAPDADRTRNLLMDTVSRLTGFPQEMLELDMEIESDLGIDSIKRVEIVSELEKQLPETATLTPENMGSLKTLRDIVEAIDQECGSQAPATATATAPAPAGNRTRELLIETVSRLTGFPQEMLELDMEIESDLGIDSIKRVEIVSELEKELPDTAALTPDNMGTLKTLGDILNAIGAVESQATATGTEAPAPATAPRSVMPVLVQTISELTGFPEEMLEPGMDLESDLGIDSIKRVEILSRLEQELPGSEAFSSDGIAQLKTLADIAAHIDGTTQAPAGDTAVEPAPVTPGDDQPKEPVSSGLVRQVIKIKSLPMDQVRFHNGAKITVSPSKTVYITQEDTGFAEALKEGFTRAGIKAKTLAMEKALTEDLSDMAGLVIVYDATAKNGDFLKSAFLLAKKSAPALMDSAGEQAAFFTTVSFLGGSFGFDGQPITDPLQGGLAGLTKTAALEWENVLCRSLDLGVTQERTDARMDAIANLTMIHGSVEMGITDDLCNIPELVAEEVRPDTTDMGKDDVFVITGGARGVTAECALALAERHSPAIVLMGRSPEPWNEPDWLTGLTNEADIKRNVMEHEFTGKLPSPAYIEARYKAIVSNREIARNLERIGNAGSDVRYVSVDVLDEKGVTALLDTVRKEHGKITGLIHGAGVLEDKFITDKSETQFSRVFDTKVRGLENLLKATEGDSLKHLVLFSSIAARTGNRGQVDYAMANEVLNKTAQAQARTRKGCRVVAVNWGPWEGGMVTPLLKNKFQKLGIDLVPLKGGAQSLVDEMETRAPVEVVIGGHLPAAPGPKPKKRKTLSQAYKTQVGTEACPVLDDHRIAGQPVVPFALMMEWFAHGAEHTNPGLCFAGIDDMRVLKGIKPGTATMDVTVNTGKCAPDKDFFKVETELSSESGLHAKGVTLLAEAGALPAPPVQSRSGNMDLEPSSLSVDGAYEGILFHGNRLKGIKAIVGTCETGIQVVAKRAGAPGTWMKNPHGKNWTMDPLLVDSAFQAAILWSCEHTGNACLPAYVANLRVYASMAESDTDVTIILTVNERNDRGIKGYFTFLDANNKVIASITGFEAVTDPSLLKSFKPQGTTAGQERFSREQILAFAEGKPSKAFGEPYRIFDNEREIARLPRPPYFFMDRVVTTEPAQWEMKPGGWIEAEFDQPTDGWYFKAARSEVLPFSILLEIALQPCGWLAAYAGSALKSDKRLYFRNLGGEATLVKPICRDMGTLTMRSRMTSVSEAGGLIIQDFDMEVLKDSEILYKGHTNFGFFTKETLANQTGIKASPLAYTPSESEMESAISVNFTDDAPLTPEDDNTSTPTGMPSKALRMIDRIDHLTMDGGVYGNGYVKAGKEVDPDEWFFKAHFYQDPVCPGSLGVESFIQLVTAYAKERLDFSPDTHEMIMAGHDHKWTYRGQITPRNKRIEVQAHIKSVTEGKHPRITADGILQVDGLIIYQMEDFTLELCKKKCDRKNAKDNLLTYDGNTGDRF